MSHRRVVVSDELPDLRFQVGHGGKASAAQTLSSNDAEDDLDLIEPGSMFRKVDKAYSVPLV